MQPDMFNRGGDERYEQVQYHSSKQHTVLNVYADITMNRYIIILTVTFIGAFIVHGQLLREL